MMYTKCFRFNFYLMPLQIIQLLTSSSIVHGLTHNNQQSQTSQGFLLFSELCNYNLTS